MTLQVFITPPDTFFRAGVGERRDRRRLGQAPPVFANFEEWLSSEAFAVFLVFARVGMVVSLLQIGRAHV